MGDAGADQIRNVTAVIVTYNSGGVLGECLSAIARASIRTVIVDNASEDNTIEIARDAGVEIIINQQNQGYGRAINRAMERVRTRYALILNPDIVLEDGAVELLESAAERYPDAGLLAPRLVEPDGRIFFQPTSLLATVLTNPDGRKSVPAGDCCAPFLSGAAILVDRILFRAIGGFDENIFLFYEDDDLCRRIMDAGRSLVHADSAIARHGRGKSTMRTRGSVYRARWHQAWSRGYVCRKYGLEGDSWSMFATNAAKTMGALLTFNPGRVERYFGSAAGALAFIRGKTALQREGL